MRVPVIVRDCASVSRCVCVCVFVCVCVRVCVCASGLACDRRNAAQDWWVGKIDATDTAKSVEYDVVGVCQNAWKLGYIVVVAVMFGGGFAALVELYVFSTGAPVYCSSNMAFLSLTLVGLLVYTPMSVASCLHVRLRGSRIRSRSAHARVLRLPRGWC